MDWQSYTSTINGRALTWAEIEALLSGRKTRQLVPVAHTGYPAPPRTAPGGKRNKSAVPFVELHGVSYSSFLRGASSPEHMAARAAELGMPALALVDRDGLYGAVQFAQAVAEHQLGTIFGAELTLDEGVLTVLARGAVGYTRLSRVIAQAAMEAGEKGKRCYPSLASLGEAAGGEWVVLADYPWVDSLDLLVAAFGASSVVVQLTADFTPANADQHEALREKAASIGLRCVLSAAPVCAGREAARLAAVKLALQRVENLEAAEAHLPAMAGWLRSGAALLAAYPQCAEEIAATVDVARACAFTLDLVAPELPTWDTPSGQSEAEYLRQLTLAGMKKRWPQHMDATSVQMRQVEHELSVIEQLDFPGYFLIVNDLVEFCRTQNILCQGRGSAANSAVCYCLGISNVDPIANNLLFERFLSPERDGPPDIDVDIESGRREEVIQYVYSTYGRENAAQVANVITYRHRGAVRDAGRALGYPPGACDAWAKGTQQPPQDVEEIAAQLRGSPRHLGIHSGGMVICDRPIASVVPTEWARMEGRSVVQWDKDDCAAAGLVKFDLLGLGMLTALHHALDLLAEAGKPMELWEIPPEDPQVYAMLSRADSVGVFQVESRAQMATLPRLKPRTFFDLVVEVALIRPGPIQGGSVHPYIRRRNGQEAVVYEHPCLQPALEKTLGIPLFQEQLMQIAKDAAGFSGAEADALRRAMGSKRSPERMERLRRRFYEGLESTQGITGEVADSLWHKMVAFAAYGFPESHSQSFAGLVYFSAWLKCHYPAQFCVALLRAQPMGFYSPQSLLADARRHGVRVHPVSVESSQVEATCVLGAAGPDRAEGPVDPGRRAAGAAIRLGLGMVKGLGADAAGRIVAARAFGGAFVDVHDVVRRAELSTAQAEALARAGGFDCLGISRRQALWLAGQRVRAGELDLRYAPAPALPGMSTFELMAQDVRSTGVTHDKHPVALLRDQLRQAGVVAARDLVSVEDGTRIRVAGVVTHRQRPQTAQGVVFFGMEDETGLINVAVSPALWERHKKLARTARALIVRGKIRNATGAATLDADKFEPFVDALGAGARDFR